MYRVTKVTIPTPPMIVDEELPCRLQKRQRTGLNDARYCYESVIHVSDEMEQSDSFANQSRNERTTRSSCTPESLEAVNLERLASLPSTPETVEDGRTPKCIHSDFSDSDVSHSDVVPLSGCGLPFVLQRTCSDPSTSYNMWMSSFISPPPSALGNYATDFGWLSEPQSTQSMTF